MYPRTELKALAARKTALVRELDRGRAELGAAAGRVLAPLELVGRLWSLGRRALRLTSFFVTARRPPGGEPPPRRASRLVTWLRWLPFVVRSVRLIRDVANAPPHRPTDRTVH